VDDNLSRNTTPSLGAMTSLEAIPDDELLRRLGTLLRDSRRTEAALVAHIGEVDRRRLYAHEACSWLPRRLQG